MSICSICKEAPARYPRRMYCGDACAREAVRAWRRALYAKAVSDYRAAVAAGRPTSVPPRLDGWTSEDKRKAYFRQYMQEWRRQRRAASSAPSVVRVA